MACSGQNFSAAAQVGEIGKGTYGTVFSLENGHVQKVAALFDEDDIIAPNIREIVILSQFSHPNINKCANVSIDNNHVLSTMPNYGITLSKWCFTVHFEKRARIMPRIIYQIVSVMAWLEEMGMWHGDLTPDNILIDPVTFHITVIDWGSVSFIPGPHKEPLCTTNFAAPEIQEHNGMTKNICALNDVFSLGMIARVMFYKEIEKPESIVSALNNGLFYYPLIEEHNNNLLSLVGSIEMQKLLQSLLIINPDRRPSAIEIFNSNLFLPFAVKDDCTLGTFVAPLILAPKEHPVITTHIRRILVQWLWEVVSGYGKKSSYVGAVDILDLYIALPETHCITEGQLQCMTIAAIAISDALITDSIISLGDLREFSENAYTIPEIMNMIETVLKALQFKVYIPSYTEKIQGSIDWETVHLLCMDEEIIGKSPDEKLLFYHKMTNRHN